MASDPGQTKGNNHLYAILSLMIILQQHKNILQRIMLGNRTETHFIDTTLTIPFVSKLQQLTLVINLYQAYMKMHRKRNLIYDLETRWHLQAPVNRQAINRRNTDWLSNISRKQSSDKIELLHGLNTNCDMISNEYNFTTDVLSF